MIILTLIRQLTFRLTNILGFYFKFCTPIELVFPYQALFHPKSVPKVFLIAYRFLY